MNFNYSYPSESEWSSWLGGGSGDKLSLTLEADEAALELGLESDLNIDWPCFLAEVGSQRPPCALCSPAEAGVTNIEGTRWYNLCWWMFGAEGHLGIPPVGSNGSKSSSIDCCFLEKKIDTVVCKKLWVSRVLKYPKKVLGGFDNIFHAYLMRRFQKYGRNWIFTVAFWGQTKAVQKCAARWAELAVLFCR